MRGTDPTEPIWNLRQMEKCTFGLGPLQNHAGGQLKDVPQDFKDDKRKIDWNTIEDLFNKRYFKLKI